MPDISLETRQKSAGEEQEKALLLKQQAELQAAKAVENFNMLDVLHRSAEWRWFHDEVLARAVNEVHDAALDVESKSAAQRDAAAQQYAFGVKLMGLLAEQRVFWAGKAGIVAARNDE